MQEHGGQAVEADGRAVEGTESQSYVVVVCAALQRRMGRVRYLICLQKAHAPFSRTPAQGTIAIGKKAGTIHVQIEIPSGTVSDD